MSDPGAYTQAMLTEDKLLISKLLTRRKFKELREFLQDIILLSEGTTYAYISGMLFILDMLHSDSRH